MSQAGHFDAENDAIALRDALNTSPPNKDELINILCGRNRKERVEIVTQFNQTADISLEHQLKSHFDGDFLKIMLSLIMNPTEYLADALHSAFVELQSGFLNIFNMFAQPKYNTIANVLCPRSNREIDELKSAYEARHGHKLEKDIRDNLSLKLKELLLTICKSLREENLTAQLESAVDDARILSLETNPYQDDDISAFIEIFTKRNFEQIKLIVEEFKKITGDPIENKIQAVFKEEDVLGFKAIVEYSEDEYFYLARCLFDGLNSKYSTLVGMVLLQCDDLQNVKRSFELNFGDSLRDLISSKTSNHYKYALYKLFGENRSKR